MVEAARTTASTAEIWVIVVVAVGTLAFWLAAVMAADRSQSRSAERSQPRAIEHPGAVRHPEPASAEGPTAGNVPGGRATMPGHPLPAPRSGDADRAERSYAGADREPDSGETGRS